MCQDRIDCCPLLDAAHTQYLVMMLLLAERERSFTRDDLRRELEGSKKHPVDIGEALDALYGVGLIHVSGELISPTRAARAMAELGPG